MKIALLYSGHIRDFENCYDNHKNNLIDILEKQFKVDVFAFFWDKRGHRDSKFEFIDEQADKHSFIFFIEKMNPKGLIIEDYNPEKFKDYNSLQWQTRPYISGKNTAMDASCMWYSCKRVFAEMEKHGHYDYVFRMRPDLIFGNKFADDFSSLTIPKWHGRAVEVSLKIMDFFAHGSYESMKVYMNTFDHILEYLKSDQYLHTAEGFLAETIKNIDKSYSNFYIFLLRPGNKLQQMF